ncbi:MAG: Lrp/AsnC family transcriptional regulator [Deltaproteobacteria bacterium]|nr:Lrp/AsnC family transcriptional regulator [Deltaproteobacteria bacterium]
MSVPRPRKLSDNERTLLAAIAASEYISAEALAKLSGLRIHVVRYLLRIFNDEKLISRSIFVDYSRLGSTIFNMFFSVSAQKRDAVLKFLANYPSVTWLTENGGERRYELSMAVQHFSELPKLTDLVHEKFGVTLKNKIWAAEVDFHFYGYKQLTKPGKLPPRYSISSAGTKLEVDELDHKILDRLRSAHFSSEKDIARNLGIPASSLSYRINRLQKGGVIRGQRWVIAVEKLGYAEYQILLDLEAASKDFHQRFLSWSATHPSILACFRCFGGWEYKILLLAPSAEGAFQFQDDLSSKFPEVAQSQLIPRRSWLKTLVRDADARVP